MKLPDDLTPAEIRVLQEFRRLQKKTMTVDEIKAIKHPVGGGEQPALSLVSKGYLSANEDRSAFTLTDKPTELLSYNPIPITEQLK